MKREAIIEVAETLFAEKGYEGASLRELGTRAGINVAMVAYYFGSKEELFKAVVELRAAEVRAYLESLNRDTTLEPFARLELYIDHYLEQRLTHRQFYRIIHQELMHDQPSQMESFLSETLRRNRDELYKIIREGKRQGVFAEVDTELTIATMVGFVNFVLNANGFVEKWFPGDASSRSEKKMRERVAEHLKSMLRAFLLSNAPTAALKTTIR